MSRFAFAILGQTAEEIFSGLPCKVKDEVLNAFVASTNPEDGYPFTIIMNNDNSYYVDGLPMSNYSVYAGSGVVPQDELSYKVFLNEEALSHFNDAMDTGARVWHHKLDDTQATLATIWSSSRISELLALKADASALQAVVDAMALLAAADHTHDAYAVKEAGDGLVALAGNKLGIALSTEDGEEDMKLNTGKRLTLKKVFTSTNYINSGWSFGQLMSALDSKLRQLQDASGAGGGFYQVLHTLQYVDATPQNLIPFGSGISTPGGGVDYYVTYLNMPLPKIPEMRQLVLYFNGAINAFTGFVKLTCGGLSVESPEFSSGAGENFALYLDISSLTSWVSHTIQIDIKNTGGDETYVESLSLVARDAVTGQVGESTYAQQNPVE